VFPQPVTCCVASSSPANLAPGAPTAGAELSRRGRGGRSVEVGRQLRGFARPWSHCPGRRDPAASLLPERGVGVRAPAAAPCAARCLLSVFLPKKSPVAGRGVIGGPEGREWGRRKAFVITSSPTAGEGSVREGDILGKRPRPLLLPSPLQPFFLRSGRNLGVSVDRVVLL
jgi:hypothetical protein